MSAVVASFPRYLLAGAIAAAANFGSRFVFSLALPFEVAVVAAYLVGMATAFVLMRRYAFGGGAADRSLARQAGAFAVVNVVAVLQTLIVSSLMLRVVLPWLGIDWHAEAVAHAFGVAVPVVSSYFGHKWFTFR